MSLDATAAVPPDPHFRSVVETTPDVVVTIDGGSRIRYVNAAVERLLGYTPQELLGRPLTLLMPQEVRQRHLHGVRRFLRTGQQHIPWDGVQFAARHKSGDAVEVEAALTTFTVAGRRYFTATLRDVRDRVRGVRWLATHRWLACQFAATRAIAEATSLTDGASRLMRDLADVLGWEVGELWLLDPGERTLRCVAAEHAEVPDLEAYCAAQRGTTASVEAGVMGRVIASGSPEWLADPAGDSTFTGAVLAGLRSGVSTSVRYGGRTGGVATFLGVDELTSDPESLELLAHLGEVVGEFVSRARAEEEIRRRERRFRALVEHADDGVVLVDGDGRIRYASPPIERMLGRSPHALNGRPALTLVHVDDRAAVRAVFEECLARPAGAARVECRCRRRNGTWRVVEAVVVNRLDDEAVRAVVVNFRDVTEARRAEAALRESEQRYALAARGARDGLWDWDLERGTIFFSDRWKSMLGLAAGEIGDDPREWFDRVHADDRARLQAAVDDHLTGRWTHFEAEYRIRHKDGAYRWMLCRGLAIHAPGGTPARMAGSQTDITERKGTEQRLLDAATRDTLTRLPNRAWVEALLQRAVDRAREASHERFALLFVDLDRFKLVNDSLGHQIGDQLLMAIAGRLEACVRPGDVVARLGGDEFAVLLGRISDIGEVVTVAERILEVLRAPFDIGGHEVFSGVSIGIADSATGYVAAPDVLRDADIAMYRAKATRPGRYQIFDEGLRARAVALHEMETGLRRAVDHGDFLLHYQPIVALTDGSIVGFEALVRWHDPQRGLRMPGEFIGVAEETGLVVPIGEWVLQHACEQMRRWVDEFGNGSRMTMNVNVAGKQLRQPDFVDRVVATLHDAGLEARHLALEITEHAIIEDPDAVSQQLAQLRTRGIGIDLDDFGTGYSSLSHLYRLPIDALKIDRSFVDTLSVSEQNRAIVRAIASLAHALGIDLVAEGIETAAQLATLKRLACRFGQGFYFSRPAPPRTIEVLLRRLGVGTGESGDA